MKKIFVLIILVMLNVNVVFAGKTDKDYSINFNGNKFHLLYSVKNKDFGGYLNEYYKKGDTYNIWTELVAVHHFPNAYSPIDRIKDFKDYLSSMRVPSSLTFNDKNNTAMIDFIMISDHSMPVVVEFNIFKYEKSKKCGSVAIQYAKRYTATTTMQIEAIKRDIEHNRKKLIKKVKNLTIPEVITKDIDKCISAADLIEENKNKTTEEVIVAEENAKKEGSEEKQTKIVSENNNIPEINKENSEEKIPEEINSNEPAENEIVQDNITEPEIAAVTDESQEDKNYSENHTAANEKSDISDEKTDNKVAEENKLNEPEFEESADIKQEAVKAAPIPLEEYNDNTIRVSKKKNKKDNYEIINNKDEYFSVPRTKKEIKSEIKKKQQIQKEKAVNVKKQAKYEKKMAQINAKKAKTIYTISNNNSDLIAKPRTEKEIKQYNKQLRKKAKERVKEAKKKLN